jgi:hypothetical protein
MPLYLLSQQSVAQLTTLTAHQTRASLMENMQKEAIVAEFDVSSGNFLKKVRITSKKTVRIFGVSAILEPRHFRQRSRKVYLLSQLSRRESTAVSALRFLVNDDSQKESFHFLMLRPTQSLAGSEVFTTVVMKNSIFWGVKLL